MNEEIIKFNQENQVWTWLTRTFDGRWILNIPPVNWIGWILIALGMGIIVLGIFLVVFTTKGLR